VLYRSEGPTVLSVDIASTITPNHGRYHDPNCLFHLNGQGRPVAIRPLPGWGQPGSFAQRRYQVVKPDEIVVLSNSALGAWMEGVSYPVN
jgi:hypothetical protein